jgi:ABC-type lipoprotein release transport system permease subunit
MSKLRMQALVILESILTVILGSVAGMMLSVPLVGFLKEHPIRLSGEASKAFERFGFEPVFPASLDSSIFLGQGLNVLLVGMVLSLYPAYVVARLHPVKAMRK